MERRGRGRLRDRQSTPPRSRDARLLDALARRLTAPLAVPAVRAIARLGIGTLGLSCAGAAMGLAAALAVALARDGLAALLVVLSRLALGLAGTARADRVAPRLADLVVAYAIPLGFAVRDPVNATAAAVLLGAVTLGAVAAARAPDTPVLGAGLSGRVGSTLFALAMIAWPAAFPILALALAGLTAMAALARLAAAGTLARAEANEDQG